MEISTVSNRATERVFSQEIDKSQELTNQIARTIFSSYPAAENSQRTINAAVGRGSSLVGVAARLFR